MCCNVPAMGAPSCGTDCDDTRAAVHPAAAEVLNGRDDDCDAMVDEGLAVDAGFDAGPQGDV